MHKETGRITTLGRGGSDTSAVAIAAAIGAERCDIYTDVDGVYTTDPRVVPKAHRMDKIAYEEMLELASLGAKVMQVRSVELGMVHNVRIFVRSSFEKPEDIDPSKPPSGTLICDEGDIVEQQVVTGIAFSKDEAQISIRRVQDKPGVAAAIFGPLADSNINVDMIVQNVSADGATTDLTFTVPSADYERARVTLDKAKGAIGFERLDGATDVAKVSVIGIGMRSHAGVAAQAFKALSEQEDQYPRHHHLRDQVLGADQSRPDRRWRCAPCIRCTGWIRRRTPRRSALREPRFGLPLAWAIGYSLTRKRPSMRIRRSLFVHDLAVDEAAAQAVAKGPQ